MKDKKEYLKEYGKRRKETHKRVEVKLTQQQYNTFEKVAKKENISVNTLIRNMAMAYKDTRYFMPYELKESIDEFNKLIRNIANNLNQMSHSANIFGEVDQKKVFNHLIEMDKAVKNFIQDKAKT